MNNYDSICCFRSNIDDKYRILWEITSKCNSKCKFCHFKGEDETTIEDVRIIVNNIKQLPIKDIILTGGEPLLNKDIFIIIDELRQNGFNVDLCSNGTFISKKLAKKIKNRLSEISISLDTTNANQYSYLRGINGLQKVYKSIENLVELEVEVHLTFVITNTNLDEMFKVAEKASELKVHSISYIALIESIAQNREFILNNSAYDRKEIIMDKIKDIRKSFPSLIINTKHLCNPNNEICKAGKNILAITSDKKLISCIMKKNEKYIDILNTKVKKDLIENYFIDTESCIK